MRRLLLRHKRKTCARFLVIPFFLFLVVSAEVVNSVYSVELGYSSLIPIDHLYFGDCINRFPFGLRVALRTNQYPKWLKVIEANHRRPRPIMAQQRPKPTTKLPTKKTPLTHRIFKWAKAAIAEAINQSLLYVLPKAFSNLIFSFFSSVLCLKLSLQIHIKRFFFPRKGHFCDLRDTPNLTQLLGCKNNKAFGTSQKNYLGTYSFEAYLIALN